jgi:hypothetical protein
MGAYDPVVKAYLEMWVIADTGAPEPDEDAILAAIRAIPNVVMADRLFGSDMIAVVETDDAAAFEASMGAVEKVDPALTISAVKLTRGR